MTAYDHCEHWRNRRQVPCPHDCPVQALPADTAAGQWLELHARVGEAVDQVLGEHRLWAALFAIWLLCLLTALTVAVLS
jgi:hypothetical protein